MAVIRSVLVAVVVAPNQVDQIVRGRGHDASRLCALPEAQSFAFRHQSQRLNAGMVHSIFVRSVYPDAVPVIRNSVPGSHIGARQQRGYVMPHDLAAVRYLADPAEETFHH